jgi:hypothetical protein
MHNYILQFCKILKYLSITGESSHLSLRVLPSNVCASSTLDKLYIGVHHFEDCLALLDGRLKVLTALIVDVVGTDYDSSIAYNMVSFSIYRIIFSNQLFRKTCL